MKKCAWVIQKYFQFFIGAAYFTVRVVILFRLKMGFGVVPFVGILMIPFSMSKSPSDEYTRNLLLEQMYYPRLIAALVISISDFFLLYWLSRECYKTKKYLVNFPYVFILCICFVFFPY